MGESGSSSVWAREATSPIGIKSELGMLAVWNSQDSRTSNRRGELGWWRCRAKASGVISSSSMNSRISLERDRGQCSGSSVQVGFMIGSLNIWFGRLSWDGMHPILHALLADLNEGW